MYLWAPSTQHPRRLTRLWCLIFVSVFNSATNSLSPLKESSSIESTFTATKVPSRSCPFTIYTTPFKFSSQINIRINIQYQIVHFLVANKNKIISHHQQTKCNLIRLHWIFKHLIEEECIRPSSNRAESKSTPMILEAPKTLAPSSA